MSDQLAIKKDIIYPFQTYPQFIRFLSGHQRKVVDALLMHNAASGSAFPSNARLSLITGYSKQTVQNLKGELCKLGVLSKKINKYGSYTYTVDTNWKREEFLAEIYGKTSTPSLESELHALKIALVSAEPEEALKLINRIKELTLEIQSGKKDKEDSKEEPTQSTTTKIDETDKKPQQPVANELLDFIVSTDKPRNPHAYKNKIRELIKKGVFDGLDEYERKYAQQQTITAINQYGKENFCITDKFNRKIKMDEESAFVLEGRFYARFEGVPIEINLEDKKIDAN
jgi:hypothetical protein